MPESVGRREQLLELVVDYVLEHGIAQLTLRGLATAVGSNNRMLLYYFGSREELVVEALHGAEAQFPSMGGVLTALDDRALSLAERLRRAWLIIADPANLPFHRLFFEIFGLAGFERDRFTVLLDAIGSEWVGHIRGAFGDAGVPASEADALAHETVALWRGFQATLLSLGDEAASTASAVVLRAADDALASLVARTVERSR